VLEEEPMNPNTMDPEPDLEFPSSDGKPMAENTRQWEAIATLKGNIEAFAPQTAFVAGDHLIYVDPTDPTERQAPDVYVAFGRPRGHRGSYMVWAEDGIFPQVIFEVLGPSNTPAEMAAKREFYFGHGAEEYYEFDPEAGTWIGFVRNSSTGQPDPVGNMEGHVSPRLGMRFGFRLMELLVYRPDGSRFLSFQETDDRAEVAERQAEAERREREAAEQRAETERLRAEAAERQAEAERREREAERLRAEAAERQAEAERREREAAEQRAETDRQRADSSQQEADRFRALLRAAGIDPDNPPAQ
jgi:Uma2 family endonuclease